MTKEKFVFVCVLILYIPVNNVSVMAERIFLGWTCFKGFWPGHIHETSLQSYRDQLESCK